MKAVLFDLDNTLYPEMDFVKSGFRAVARYLNSRYGLDESELLEQQLDIMRRDGRGRVFDSLLKSIGRYDEARVRLLVAVYRSHRPEITLYDDALPTLQALRSQGCALGLVTDWMASVQRNKIAALGLAGHFDAIVCTDELGAGYAKPSPVPFRVALELLQVEPPEAAFVGDDPAKDFPAPNEMGMLTIRLNREAAPEASSDAGRACHVINSLAAVSEIVMAEGR